LTVTSCPFIKAKWPLNPWTALTTAHLGLHVARLTSFRPVKYLAGIATEETTMTEKPSFREARKYVWGRLVVAELSNCLCGPLPPQPARTTPTDTTAAVSFTKRVTADFLDFPIPGVGV
jgi:hypothetical protein